MEKLAVEKKYNELKKLRYVEYSYVLNYKKMIVDNVNQTAEVEVSEEFEIICERAIEYDSKNPRTCAVGELTHEIILQKENDQWKIISDIYWDAWWRQFRTPGSSTDEILLSIAKMNGILDKTSFTNDIVSESNDIEFSCELSDDTSSHEYERDDAVNYAQTHAIPDDYNLFYPSYDDETYGDCTNFVSQSIYENGDASMFLITPVTTRTIEGQSGWFLLNGMQRASAWNHVGGSPDVNAFYDFVLENGNSEYITEGPEGCEIPYSTETPMATVLSQIQIGDVIQYEWEGDEYWDHSVIVVSKEGGTVQVASHSPNFGSADYDFRHYEGIRFIHIERSDGEPPVKSDIDYPTHDENSMDCDGVYLGNEVYLGACDVNGGQVDITSGFNFDDIDIPYGAEIKYAYITFSVDGEYNNELDECTAKTYL